MVKALNLKNFGVVEERLPKKLYELLLEECISGEENNPELITGLTNRKDMAKHRHLVVNKENLWEYINQLLINYNKVFPGVENIKVLTRSLPFSLGMPWINYQRKGEYLPQHIHDGIYSYSMWIKIPSPCLFQFTYTNIIGDIITHPLNITKEDEGKIVFFPSKLPHTVFPFNDSEETRISISGNVLFDSNF
tara:strand:+ start:7196 stop:7771 length:576 start_codon:yes stop_codon:yes gene_type:complete